MNCVICDNQLETHYFNSIISGGGNIKFRFGYGSKHDSEYCGVVEYVGIVCDGCADKYIDKMTKLDYDMNGHVVNTCVPGEDGEAVAG